MFVGARVLGISSEDALECLFFVRMLAYECYMTICAEVQISILDFCFTVLGVDFILKRAGVSRHCRTLF